METIMLFVVAAIFFIIFHRIFHVTYFGLKGVLGTGIICLLIAAPVVRFASDHIGWIIVIGIILAVLIFIGKKNGNTTGGSNS